MKKRIIVGITSFIIGLGASFILEPFLRNIVIDLFQSTTNGNIQFVGKDFYLFTPPFFYLSFGISFMIFGIEATSNKATDNLKNGILWIGIFSLALVSICAFDANVKIMECTACDDGIRKLGYSELYYGLILGICALLSGLPSLTRLIKNRNKSTFKRIDLQGVN